MTTEQASKNHKNPPGSPGRCAGCGGRIEERYYLMAVDREWHVHCLTCSDCHVHLDTQLTCFARDGRIYCKDDYYRRYALKRCSGCQQGISSSELVMRAREQVFHLTCFACSACNRALTPGEEFTLHEHLLLCSTDFQLLFHGEYIAGLSPSSGSGFSNAGGPSRGNQNQTRCVPFRHGSCSGVSKCKSRRRKSSVRSGNSCTGLGLDVTDGPGDLLDQGDGYGVHPNAGRQKRVRTSFKHQQLRTMKSYFSLNHNPDAKDLKQLALRTGLSKRVLQVWFQNARAKYRRSQTKQQGDPLEANELTPAGPTTTTTTTTIYTTTNTNTTTTTILGPPSPSATGNENSEFGDEPKEGSAVTDNFSNSRSPAALSDISSTASVSGGGEVTLSRVHLVDYDCGDLQGADDSGGCAGDDGGGGAAAAFVEEVFACGVAAYTGIH